MWKAYVDPDPARMSYILTVLGGRDKKTRLAGLEFVEFEEDSYVPDDELVRVHKEMLQSIVDACYDAGIKPSERKHADYAQQKHLEDMRFLAFHYAKCEKP